MKNIKNLLVIIVMVFIGTFFTSMSVDAASFEVMKEDVEKGEGVVYNPVLNRVMTTGETEEFISIVENEMAKSHILESTIDIFDINVSASSGADLGIFKDVVEINDTPIISTFGAKPPVKTHLLKEPLPYSSQPFSGSGTRYSGKFFYFKNYYKVYLFGVRAEIDTFYFHTRANRNLSPYRRYVVPVSSKYVFFPSRSYKGDLQGYFSTTNPLKGSRYFIK
ncbi:hypothetical protein A5821_002177 [Enterococcus sp. 7F3_DIV0205]|uniref:Uncharacterized protein n=1 Tax=Candidatus Enterococcus palustris TaxID=1834189 RepID=A0AAQ3WBL5_9ENTE|nr:hypothetical protein [Enterococcus sp. 7F3_DIV0205]OTN82616.1 hypothetical protein A5821_002527 [Enterococcus sp. 7F3_DIV0205]